MAHCGLLILLLALSGFVAAQDDVHEGSECQLANGSTGVCVLLYNCEPALKTLFSGGRPVTCSYSSFTPVVCCSQSPPVIPESSTSKPSPPPPPPPPPPSKQTPTPKPSTSAGRISERKCQEYGKSVFRIENTFIPGEKINRSLCGTQEGGVPFILGGTEVKAKEYPHAAIIGYEINGNKNWLCGGTLISERFILTAAHCLEDHSKEGVSDPLYVRLGEADLAVETESEIQEFTVKAFYMHPDYKPPLKYNDIGLIEMDGDAEFDQYVRPACLQTTKDDFNKNSIVVGWGKTEYAQFKPQGSAWSQKLLKAEIQWSPVDYCESKYDSLSRTTIERVLPQGIVDDTMLCFGDKTGKKDACGGDSGGPLQYLRSSPYCMHTVLGITSFGNRCGKPDFPAIYTRVSYFVPWIESIVWPNEK